MRKIKRLGKTFAAALVGLTIITSSFSPVSEAAQSKGKGKDPIVFKTQVGGVFDGMPLFDGNPKHLDAYVDKYFEYTGLEGPAVYATGSRNHYTLQQGENKGKVIPGALSAANDGQGVSTDFPALVGMGQTWNKQLVSDIGKVIGNEKISTLKVKQGESNLHPAGWGDDPNASKTVAFTVISDLRINPLTGRFDEGFTEDPYLGSIMVDNMAAGLGGTDQPESDDGFWMRAAVGGRHFSVYHSQWFRQNAENSASARSIYEYHTKSSLKAFKSGSLSGVMTSFGATNGIPNILSPYQTYANNISKYGVYSSPDFNADARVFEEGSFGNGYDTKYAKDRTHATVLMLLADANAGRPMPSVDFAKTDVLALVDAVEKGLYGITKEDLIDAARPHVNQMVRVGIFNEVDENGVPKYYPFAKDAGDVAESKSNYSSPEHQEIAKKAAEESIVLLKNDGVLPLDKNKKAAISGIYADARFKTTYSVAVTPDIENSGLSPLSAILKEIGKEKVSYHTGNPIIGLTSKLNDKAVSVGEATDGGQLVTTSDELNAKNNTQLFEVYDWGQEGQSLLSLYNNRWVTSPDKGNVAIGNTDKTILNLTSNDWDGHQIESGDTSTIPPRLRMEDNEDETVSIVTNGYLAGFGGSFVNWYYANGRFISTTEAGNLETTSNILTNVENASNRGNNVKFDKTIVKEVGEDAAARAKEDDYAVVFVGAIPRHSAGEGNDRSSLDMGKNDYELVEKVSAAFAAQGKKTVVVVKSSFPVGMEEIEKNPNVSAIVYQPYAGQYDSHALADVLYGDSTPTGRLSSTWYKDLSAFQTLNNYSIPEGQNAVKLEDVDPRFKVDMTNADPIESNLTYMYTDAAVTYEFGYGLSYSEFKYSNFKVPNTASYKKPFNVTVDVKNTGKVETSDVVQLYIKNNDSAYGDSAPKKQLIGFEKVQVAPGETKKVTLTIDPETFNVWDVNKGDFIVEDGRYTLMVGASSENIKEEKTIKVNGQSIKPLKEKSINVFDHSFASNEVIYQEVSKARTASNLKDEKVVGGYHAVRSKQEGSWVALPKVNISNARKVTARVATNVKGGKISLHVGSPEGKEIAVFEVPKTEPTSYTLKNTEVEVNELGYVDVTAELNKRVSGNNNLYVVFHDADLRIDSLTWSKQGKDLSEINK